MVGDDPFSRKVKDIAAEFVSGLTQVLIGQPADLVKIRLQTSPTPTTSSATIHQVPKKEGPLALCK